ncbi:MAG: flagellar export chaperone FliS [Motiliproteus sp.]|nr:flagellar export chaperone FliS [Motiliproteus sp.]MCW9051997.1 flagellar export chaperone FliS [Motiliproteus sp.]
MTYNQKALKQYQSVDVSSAVNSASPHKLISMLFDGALTALARAKGMIERKDVSGRTEQINKVCDIIIGLKGSLDLEQGGEVATNLDSLYDYMLTRMLAANSQNSVEAVDEVTKLLAEVKTGWEQMPEDAK